MKKLNPLLWEKNGHLKKKVRDRLLKIADFFIQYTDIPEEFVKDIYLVGSNASYNYKPTSDIDIHVVISPQGEKNYIECLTKYLDAKRKLFNDEFEFKIYSHDVEVYPQMEDEQLVSSGIYSIKHDKWIKKPEINEIPQIDDMAFKSKYEKIMHIIGDILASGCKDYEKIRKFFKKLKKLRKSSLEHGGEFSIENLVYKKLRDEGIITSLLTCMRKAKSKELSLEHILSWKS